MVEHERGRRVAMRGARGLAALGIGIAAWGAVAPLHAQPLEPSAFALSWNAPDTCPDEAEARAAIERTLGADASTLSDPLDVEVAITREGPAAFRLQLVTLHRGDRGERRLQATDCQALLQSVTLLLSVLVAAQPAPAPPPEPAPPEPAPEAPLEAPPPKPEPPILAPVERRPALSLWLGPSAQLGLAPRAGLGASLGLELASRAWVVGMRAFGFGGLVERTAPRVRTHVDGIGVALLACGRAEAGSVLLGLCGGAYGAGLQGRSLGRGVEAGRALAPWYAVFAGPSLTWPRDAALALRLFADVGLSLVRPRFAVDGLGTAHRVPWVTGAVGVGAVWSP